MNILRISFKPPSLTPLVILLGLMGCSGGSGTSNPTDPAEPVFGLDRFGTGSATVDNRWFPLVPGTTNILEGQNEEGDIETVVITVSHEIREINGISSAIVIDREYEDGELVEETFDWYAQDLEGHVWYMGEASTEFDD
nr:hypothetical protein [Granulosicoccus sp.]